MLNVITPQSAQSALVRFHASEDFDRHFASPYNRLTGPGFHLMSAGHNRGGLLLQLHRQVLRASAKFLSSTRVPDDDFRCGLDLPLVISCSWRRPLRWKD
jgi:hypothetical protein